MPYTVILKQEDDGGYVARVPALSVCVSQGGTRDEVMANIQEAIKLYVDDCLDGGNPVPVEDGR
jgi:predicted RNase H-like HicB family nuclease